MERSEDGLVRVGILGCGNVGSALVGLLDTNADLITRRSGVRIEVARVAVQNLTKERDVELAAGVLTNDAGSVVSAPDVDVIVEVIGGVEPARSLILTALKAGKPVVTANKELLANVGEELFEVAATAGVDLLFEASVAGGIPLIRPLRESLVGERIRRVTGMPRMSPTATSAGSRASRARRSPCSQCLPAIVATSERSAPTRPGRNDS